jgi:L-fucose isomerase-like protein
LLSLSGLKIFSFGPRPQDFLACNAPIKALYDLGIEIMENSELDLYDIFLKAKDDRRVATIVKEMQEELGEGKYYPDLLQKLAQYEAALMKFYDDNLGASKYGIFAIKCWPAFESYFGFVPCYVNSRMAAKGIPISCEVDIYGALSEYIATVASSQPATILDINNTVPKTLAQTVKGYEPTDLFMGFHCGNTTSSCMKECSMKYQLIMHRLLEGEKEPDITRGTLEGQIKPGNVTIFRLQSTADTNLCAYIAQGEVLDIDPKSFGGIGIFAIKEMGRFYRYVLIQKRYPHHTAVAFDHIGKILYEILKILGITDISYNQAKNVLYEKENPFS